MLDPAALTAQQTVQTAWQQAGRNPKSLTGWTSTRRDDGTLLLTAHVTGIADPEVLCLFAAHRSPLLADYIKPGTGDTLPALDYPAPGRTALSWRTGSVWVELWHQDTPTAPERPTPALMPQHAPPRGVPSARLPFTRLRRLSGTGTYRPVVAYRGVWVELWHDEPTIPAPKPTPALHAVQTARTAPGARLPFARLRNALTNAKEKKTA